MNEGIRGINRNKNTIKSFKKFKKEDKAAVFRVYILR